MKEVLFMSPAAHFKNFDFKLTFGRENSTGFLTHAFDFSHHSHALVTQFLCSDWSKFDR